MKNPKTQDQYKISEGNKQLVLILNSEILLPEDTPVRVTSAQLEELDYRKLYEAYSSKGRKSVTDDGLKSLFPSRRSQLAMILIPERHICGTAIQGSK